MPPATTIDSTPDLSVRVLFNDGHRRVDAVEARSPRSARTGAPRCDARRGNARGRPREERARTLGATDKVIYLYCHAVASAKDSDDSSSSVSDRGADLTRSAAVFAPIEDLLRAIRSSSSMRANRASSPRTSTTDSCPTSSQRARAGSSARNARRRAVRERVGEGVLRRLFAGKTLGRRRARTAPAASSPSTTTRSACCTGCTATPTRVVAPALRRRADPADHRAKGVRRCHCGASPASPSSTT